MRGLGTIINVLAVIVGGTIGVLLKSKLNKRFQDGLMHACGVATIFIGVGGALSGLLKLNPDGTFTTQKTMVMVLSLVLGALLGELLQIEKGMEILGEKLRNLFRQKENGTFVEGFVTASLVICVGAMAIVGSIQDGLTGDYSMLLSKAILDFIIVAVFASTLGFGTILSCIPLGLYQGAITVFAVIASRYLSDSLIADMSCIGCILIFCVGINITFGKKIKVGNVLPAMFFPILFHVFNISI